MMKQIELIEKRKPREKHFLREDGTILAEVYDTDIHYLKDGKYEEIDNTLVSENGVLRNKNNDYKVEFKENFRDSLMKMTKDDHYIDFKIRQSSIGNLKSEKRKISKKMQNITYNNITDDIKVEYQTLSNKVKETIVLQNANYSELSFELDTNLNLSNENGEIIAKDENGTVIFNIEKPYMIDSNQIRNDNIHCLLDSFDDGYILTLVLDDEWLNSEERKFPVYIDPTISNNSQNISLYDTYIYPGDTNDVRSNKPYLKAGVEKVNGSIRPNRTLIKFSLPTIGTGSEIIYATLDLISYPTNTPYPTERVATIHRITANWDETTANWNNMNDKYEKRVESMFYGSRSRLDGNTVIPRHSDYDGNITNLVKKWYRDTPNYGVMIKAVDETKYVDEDYPVFYSKDNTLPSDNNPKPIFSLVYRNHNGLESYLDYRTQTFTDVVSHVNTYNGNLVSVFNLGHTVGGNLPVDLNLVYNTNDVILDNSTFFKKGFKLNLEQTIKNITINDVNYLEYLDEDATTHYFTFESSSSTYKDEDGLNLTIQKTDTVCTMSDSNSNKMIFTKIEDIYRLTKIEDINGNTIVIMFNDNNSINKVIDKFGNEVNIVYGTNNIVINSPDMTTTLNYTNHLLTSIETINGTTTFGYNSNGLINSITDVTGLKMNYEYYSNLPYRVSKVSQVGLNNELGEYFNLDYGFDSTNIIDSNGRITTLIYNSYGNLVSENSLISGEDVNSAYSINRTVGNDSNNQNRILSSEIPIKFSKNYLKNASFENDINYFDIDNERVLTSYSTEEYVSGNRSLKIDTLMVGQSIEQVLDVPKGEYYTFSGYFKANQEIEIKLIYANEDGEAVFSNQIISPSNEFDRNDITIYYDTNATSNLRLVISFPDVCTTYIDDIQLEKGEVANNFNMIENPDFSEGYSDWELDTWTYGEGDITPDSSFSIAKFNNNKNTALKVSTNPTYGVKFIKTIPVKGKKGDLYTCSFWYKNLGIPGYAQITGCYVSIYFKPVGQDAEYCIGQSGNFNPNENKWQFFTYRSHALEDFEYIKLIFIIGREANDFYLTNLSLYKDVTSGEYNYDENGNLVSTTDQSNNTNVFKYDKNNQLISMTNALGKNFKYEYDNNKVDRVLNAISSSGISNRIIYDLNGNPIYTRISKRYTDEIENEGLYKIRSKGTNKHLKAELNLVLLEENECSNTIWKFVKSDDYYKILYSVQPEYSISYRNGNIVLDKEDTNNLFQLEKNNDSLNGAYYIVYNEVLPTGGTNVRFLKANGENIQLSTFGDDSLNMEFYIELKDELFIEKSAKYTDDGRFITSVVDDKSEELRYETDTTNGIITSITNANNSKTEYTYNDRNLITKIKNGNKYVEYNYNNQNLLTKIKQNSKEYNFIYDDFLNTKRVMLGDSIILTTNEYKSNGDLQKIIYGNDQRIEYEYDEFDRIKKVKRMDETYKYLYDNNSNIAKITSDNHNIKYNYDLCNRIYKYSDDELKIKYTYDSEDNVTKKIYMLDNINCVIENIINNKTLTKTLCKNQEINYSFDSLGRLINKNINNQYDIAYKYISKGKKTSDSSISIINGNDEYSYEYDKLYNIKKEYHNDNIEMEYEYGELNELISEIDYNLNRKTVYTYDSAGNLTEEKIIDCSTDAIQESISYNYSNNLWEDQLTNYDGVDIIYDEIGNPISIGNNINLSWINGRSLSQYSDNNLNIYYEYNVDGIRISKTVNGIKTNYYVEDNDIIFEKTGNSVIQYLYDLTGRIGLEYNGEIYYYIKNLQDDVIGIMNSNYEKIVEYKYDSWGKIVSIKDIDGLDIVDSNNIGIINPFRYRSYYYDNETKLYYLNSRYYNPQWRRFINPDTILCANQDILSHNLYLYCSNNPVTATDESGKGIISKIIKAAVKIYTKIKKAVTKPKKKTPKKQSTPSKPKTTTAKKNTSNKSSNLPDYTKPLNKVLNENRIKGEIISNSTGYIGSFPFFHEVEKKGGIWDYKLDDNWERDIDAPFLGWDGKFIYNGKVTTAEDFGNIHYGYVGSAMGFPEKILYIGGGYAACGIKKEIFQSPYYCDKANDHAAIKRGIDMYYGVDN